jgi:CBS domain containing-hemolysin-like protein
MEIELFQWIGFVLSFLAAFFISLFHISLSSFSKISLRSFLEERDTETGRKVIDRYDEIRVSLEFLRVILILAFFAYMFILFPRLRFWPLWMFLVVAVLYLFFFDWLPRILNTFTKGRILWVFLPSSGILSVLAKPFLFLERRKETEKEEDEEHEATEEEIQALIEEAKEEGIIEKEEGPLLRSVVEFGDTFVREIMTPRVEMICIRKGASIQQLRDLVIKEKHSRIPVYKERIDNIEGNIVAKDLLEYSDDKHQNDPIAPLIREVYFVPESMKVADLLKELQRRREKMAIVVDEHGGVSGLVTMEDVMEEIVGEIQDEYDKEEVDFIEKGPFDYIVMGDAEIEELEKRFKTELAEGDFLTVGGLITHTLGHLPHQGERFQIKGLTFEVLDVDQKRIKTLRIKKIR